MTFPIDSVFSFRVEGLRVFAAALRYNPKDGTAHYYLGLIWAKLADLDKTIAHWRESVKLVHDNPRAWRNLGLALRHNDCDLEESLKCYEKAFAMAQDDSRILLELDEVRQELRHDPEERLRLLKQNLSTVESRDDLLKSMLDLMLQAEEYEEAMEYFDTHYFQLWEGKYDIHNAYMDANMALARSAETPEKSLEYFQRACEYPANLEVAPREPNLRGFLYYPMAQLHRQLGNDDEAIRLLKITAEEISDYPTLGSYYQALALRELGQNQRADEVLAELKKVTQALLDGNATEYQWESANLQKALGLYYSAKLEETSGNSEQAQIHLEEAKSLEPLIERRAIIMAQLVYARAHQ
jgi:tetratricopeptide (TPR) repeat protein